MVRSLGMWKSPLNKWQVVWRRSPRIGRVALLGCAYGGAVVVVSPLFPRRRGGFNNCVRCAWRFALLLNARRANVLSVNFWPATQGQFYPRATSPPHTMRSIHSIMRVCVFTRAASDLSRSDHHAALWGQFSAQVALLWAHIFVYCAGFCQRVCVCVWFVMRCRWCVFCFPWTAHQRR